MDCQIIIIASIILSEEGCKGGRKEKENRHPARIFGRVYILVRVIRKAEPVGDKY